MVGHQTAQVTGPDGTVVERRWEKADMTFKMEEGVFLSACVCARLPQEREQLVLYHAGRG